MNSLPVVTFVVFSILKLTEVIDWSWWWVTSPLWISTGLGLVGLLVFGAGAGALYATGRGKRREINRADLKFWK